MADTFETKPNNFGNTNQSHTKYLDLAGLKEFWGRVKDYIDTQDLTIYDKIKDISGLDIDDLLVIGKGDANNSAVLKGEYQGYSNKALSQVSVSLGAASTAGLKGWYYSAITFGANPVITLSDTQPYVLVNALRGGSWSSGTPNIKAGDKISIVNDAKYDYCGEVKSISGNKITLKEALPFDSLATSLISVNDPDDWTIYLPDRADAGIIDFGGGAFAEGVNTQATNIGAHAEGIQTHAYGQYSHTEGFRTEAAYAAHAEGRQSKALGRQSHAEGENNEAHGDNSHVEGKNSKTLSKFSHAEGNTTIAKGEASHTEGYKTISVNNTSHAEGSQTVAYGGNAHAEGQGGSYDAEIYDKTKEEIVELWDAEMKINCALGKSSHTEGLNTLAVGDYSHAEGNQTKAQGNSAHAEGKLTVAVKDYSHAEGYSTNASALASHAEGHITVASGDYSHAEGLNARATASRAHAEGNGTTASGEQSHAEGNGTKASAPRSHAEGNGTEASGNQSHAEGYKTKAKSTNSHAGGSTSTADGARSFVHGYNAVTTKDDEVAFGKYNKSESNTLFSIGDGTSETDRKNAFEITKTAGYIYDKQIATLEDIPVVDTELNPDSNNPIANSVVANAIKGGVHFRGVYDRLPDELVDMRDEEGNEIDYEIKQIGRWYSNEMSGDGEKPIDFEVIFYEGDVIIVSPNVGDGDSDGEYILEEPTKEYILTYAGSAIDEWYWVELGDVTPAQGMINESLKNYYKKLEVDSKISYVQSQFGDYVPRSTYTESYNEEEVKCVEILNQDVYSPGWNSDLFRYSDIMIEPHQITLSTYEDYANDEDESDDSRSNTLKLSAEQGLRLNDNEVLTVDANNNLSKSELKIGHVEISNSDQQPNYTFNGSVYISEDDRHHSFDIVAEWDGEDPESHLHPYYSEPIEVCKFVVTSINWEYDESEFEDDEGENWRSHVEDELLSEVGRLFISVECMNDTTIQVTDSKSWIDAGVYDAGNDSISGTITVTMPYSLKKLSKLTVNGNEVLAVDNEGVLDKDTLIVTDGGYNQFIVGNDFGLIANHTYEMNGGTMQTMIGALPANGTAGAMVTYSSDQFSAQSGFVAEGQTVHIIAGGENSETGESALTQLVVHPGGAAINNVPILTGTRIEDSKILGLFS